MRTESQGCCTRWQNRTHSPVPRAAPACLQLEKNNRGKNVAGGGNCLGQIVPKSKFILLLSTDTCTRVR